MVRMARYALTHPNKKIILSTLTHELLSQNIATKVFMPGAFFVPAKQEDYPDVEKWELYEKYGTPAPALIPEEYIKSHKKGRSGLEHVLLV